MQGFASGSVTPTGGLDRNKFCHQVFPGPTESPSVDLSDKSLLHDMFEVRYHETRDTNQRMLPIDDDDSRNKLSPRFTDHPSSLD